MLGARVRVMVLNATFNNISVISWRSVWLVEESGVPGENNRPAASHWQTLSHNVVSSTCIWVGLIFELTTLGVIGAHYIYNLKSIYHTMTTSTTPNSIIYCSNYMLNIKRYIYILLSCENFQMLLKRYTSLICRKFYEI